jgi:4'-phosphopantetheinyl transferase
MIDVLKAVNMDTSKSLWHSPPEHLVLGCDEVHVWRAMLDIPIAHVQTLEQTLAADERTRAERFHFPKDRTHFIVARGLLRAILGHYLARDPHTLRFCSSQYGKPVLIWESGSNGLCFNVTHSHGMALYAITRNREVGIDLEYIHTEVAWEHIAERFFSSREKSLLRTVPRQMQHKAFFVCWTRKEAYLKARGMGLMLPLSQFDVSVTPGAPAALLRTREEDQDISDWSLHELSPGSNYVAALAVQGHPCRFQYWQWPEVLEGAKNPC